MLTQNRLKELLHYDLESGIFKWKVARSVPIGSIAGRKNTAGHIQISIDNRRYQAHRLAWLYVYGFWPGQDIDHINRVKDDNRIVNLRDVSRSANCYNVIDPQSNNKTKVLGVHFCNRQKKYVAQIVKNNKKLFLGYFDNIVDAKSKYDKVKNELLMDIGLVKRPPVVKRTRKAKA